MALVPTGHIKTIDDARRAIQKLASNKLGPDASPTFYGLTLTTPLTVPNGGTGLATITDHGLLLGSGTGAITPLAEATDGQIPIGDTDGDPILATITGTANQVNIANAAGSITLSTPQNIHTGATPTFAGLTIVNAITEFSTDGTFADNSDSAVPTEKATKTYVDLAIGASKDFFLSDNDDAVIADYHILYETDTGEAASTLFTDPAMGVDDDQLMFSYITPAGVPGVTFLRAGVYILHTHLARTTGNRTTKFYWELRKRILAGTETVLMSSEESSEIPNVMTSFITHATLISDTAILTTDRLVLKLYANVTGGGADSVITIYMEGTNDCHLTNLLPSDIWQSQGDILDDLNTLGIVGADSEFLVGTAEGALTWESGATVRTSLGLVIGTNVQAYHVNLASLAGLTYAAASFVKMTGANTFALRTIGEIADDLETTIDHDNLANGGAHDYAYISGNDGATGITAAELEELSDGSATTLHNHAGNGVSTWIALTDTDPVNYTDEAGHCVVVNAGEDGLEFGTAPGGGFTSRANAYLNNNQSIPKLEWTTMLFDVENYDNDSEFDIVTNKGRFVAAVNGYYHITAMTRIDKMTDQIGIWISVYKNNTTRYFQRRYYTNGTERTTLVCSGDIQLSAEDFIEVQIHHASPDSEIINGGESLTNIQIHRFA